MQMKEIMRTRISIAITYIAEKQSLLQPALRMPLMALELLIHIISHRNANITSANRRVSQALYPEITCALQS